MSPGSRSNLSVGALVVEVSLHIFAVGTLFFGLVGFVTMICSRYRQRVGDHVAGTLVVRAYDQAAQQPG